MKKKELKHRSSLALLALVALVLSACGSRPGWVLSPEKMEDVLFDMHIAEAQIDNNYQLFSDNQKKKEELLHAVFEKHKISTQEFDTSVVWYNGHLDTYLKIYERLNQRYTVLADTLRKENQVEIDRQESARRVDLWNDPNPILLESNLYPYFSFRIDTAQFYVGDNYELSFNVLGLTKKDSLNVTFYVEFPDTTVIQRKTVKQNESVLTTIAGFTQKANSLSGSVCSSHTQGNSSKLVLFNVKIRQQKPVRVLHNYP